ncbi:hypothetical protein [Streptomyces zagrosensis]|uniref:Uncharacterized protein n=1 Tax=Streptomyces zagrosensis TaxID=1042984 RepID=A0A7W9QH14_9ACTN|nr:hypothetical protein [Streptomyces zagrosensis]MBB5940103.1 hypothetical protein [Streptomyces zagrosensis]
MDQIGREDLDRWAAGVQRLGHEGNLVSGVAARKAITPARPSARG